VQEDPVRLLTASRDSLTKPLNDRIAADATREPPLDVVLDIDEALLVLEKPVHVQTPESPSRQRGDRHDANLQGSIDHRPWQQNDKLHMTMTGWRHDLQTKE
jgi:hypothetical protein